jgi:DNA repair protein RecN (Recombination protein N)
MKGTRFSVNIQNRDGEKPIDRCNQYGFDSVEFLISANDGSPLKPLAKIASGGELSRVMLALKTVLAASDTVDTLIFDEIDTGIGGEVSVAVGRHMKNLALTKQILCITHLASIAVYADNQLKIQKISADGNTETHVDYVTGEDRVSEIARMLSGDTNSSLSLEHARSMLKTYGGI